VEQAREEDQTLKGLIAALIFLKKRLQKYLITGLLVWIPLGITLLLIEFIIRLLDRTVALLPAAYRPAELLGFNIHGLGAVISIVIVFFTGVLVTNILGRKIVHFGESIVQRIPLVRSIYNASKQVAHTLFDPDGKSFKKVYMIEYPRKDVWSIAFLTSEGAFKLKEADEDAMLTLFVPTTPNPTSGFIVFVPSRDAIELKMTIDEALRLVISLGVAVPVTKVLE